MSKDPIDPKKQTNPTQEALQSEIDDLEKSVIDQLNPSQQGMLKDAEKKMQPLEEKLVKVLTDKGYGATALEILKKAKATIQQKVQHTVNESNLQNKDPFDQTPRLRKNKNEDDDFTPPRNR